ncbi:hypothetical protein FB107DRAFT_292717 [Schizophyllum commune]
MRRRSSRASPDLQDLRFCEQGVALPRYLGPPGPAASTLKLIIDPSSQMGLRNFSPRDRGVAYGGQGLLREEGGGPREAT